MPRFVSNSRIPAVWIPLTNEDGTVTEEEIDAADTMNLIDTSVSTDRRCLQCTTLITLFQAFCWRCWLRNRGGD